MTHGAIELYWISGSPYAWRTLLTLEFKGVPYVSRLLEVSKGDLKSAEFRALNPRGRVPVLKDGSFVLSESMAIMAYLEKKFPSSPLFGNNDAETGRVWQSISECSSYFVPQWSALVFPIYSNTFAEKTGEIKAAAANTHAELERFEHTLASQQWLAGSTVSAADFALYPFVAVLERASGVPAKRGLDLGFLPLSQRYPGLWRWIGQLQALPGYEKTYPPHWRQAIP